MSLKSSFIRAYKAVIPLFIRVRIRIQYDVFIYFLRYRFNLKRKYWYEMPHNNMDTLLATFSGNPSPSFAVFVLLNEAENIAIETKNSIELQVYPSWKLVESRYDNFTALARECNQDYLIVVRNGDLLTQDALLLSAMDLAVSHAPLLYSDNDHFVDQDRYVLPDFKPDYSPESLLSKNYLTGLIAFKRDALLTVLNNDRGKVNVYDLVLKMTDELRTPVSHIAVVLYHRKISKSQSKRVEKIVAENGNDARIALQAALKRRKIDAEIIETPYVGIFRVKRKLLATPLVSIMIPFKDKPEILKVCLDSILKYSTYKNVEVVCINNNSTEQSTFDMMKHYTALDSRISFVDKPIPFNFSELNNFAVTICKGEQLILLNNDIGIITPDWIESLLEYSQLDHVGVVGAKLYYPNELLQHGGVIVGIGGVAGHSHKMVKRNCFGYFGRLQYTHNISAITAACIMVKKRIYLEVDGLDEVNFKVAFNDVDFCLKVQYRGYDNIFTPYCEAYHHESISRGIENTPEKRRRFESEIDAFKRLHEDFLLKGDPYYNPNLTLHAENNDISHTLYRPLGRFS